MNRQTVDFRNYTLPEITGIFLQNQFNPVKINNFRQALRTQAVDSLDQLKKIRRLTKVLPFLPFQPLKLVQSIQDECKNEKFVFSTFDQKLIEAVLMPDKKNISICISVQAGCKMGCCFCNTGQNGLKRSLYAHEILDQIRQIYQLRIYPRRLACLSFMGMGEPFDNLKNCMHALDWIVSAWGWQVSRLKCTFSTCGCLPFDNFLKYTRLPNLAVSLHSAVESKRKKLLPKAVLSLPELKQSMLAYTQKTRKQISIEYCLFKNINDSEQDARSLARYLAGLPCKVNLLNYNPTAKCTYQPVLPAVIDCFKDQLKKQKLPVLYRKSLGTPIAAGCGQLGSR